MTDCLDSCKELTDKSLFFISEALKKLPSVVSLYLNLAGYVLGGFLAAKASIDVTKSHIKGLDALQKESKDPNFSINSALIFKGK